MTVVFVPRSSWHPAAPTSNSGATRPKLTRPVPTITRHYTGSPPDAKVRFWEPGDWMTWFQGVAVNAGKSFEYNYVIPPRNDGSSQVWEYAGDYQAAHSQDENAVAVGVLFAIGVTNHPSYANYTPTKPTVWEPITAAMIDAYRWLRDVHLPGVIDPSTVQEVEHRHMPGAATACPGNEVIAADAELDLPWEDSTVAVSYFKLPGANPLTVWATADGLTAVRLEASQANARGVDVFKVPVLPEIEADKFVYVNGLPAASVK